jgi:hypothetical protein
VFVKVAIPIFFLLSLFVSRVIFSSFSSFFFFVFLFLFFELLPHIFSRNKTPYTYGWVLDDFLATRADRRLVVRFRRHRSGATGVRATD